MKLCTQIKECTTGLSVTEEKEKTDLLSEIMNLKQELRNTKLDVEAQKSNESNDFSNVDIIRRLSQLEKIVYSMKKEEEENNN